MTTVASITEPRNLMPCLPGLGSGLPQISASRQSQQYRCVTISWNISTLAWSLSAQKQPHSLAGLAVMPRMSLPKAVCLMTSWI